MDDIEGRMARAALEQLAADLNAARPDGEMSKADWRTVLDRARGREASDEYDMLAWDPVVDGEPLNGQRWDTLPAQAKEWVRQIAKKVPDWTYCPEWVQTLAGAPWGDDLGLFVEVVQAHPDEQAELYDAMVQTTKVTKRFESLRIDQLAKERLRREAEPATLSIRELIARDTAQSLLDETLPAALIEGHLDAGSLARLVGEPGDGKTFAAVHMGLCLATGKPWRRGFTAAPPTRVVYLAAEGGRRYFAERLKAWAVRYNGGVMPAPEWFTPIVDRLQILSARFDELVALFDPAVGGESVGLFVFDTQAKMTEGVDENSNTEAAQVERRLAELAERTGAAVILLHHPAYGTKRGRGASAVTGAMDSEWFISQDEKTEVVTMETTKQKHHPMGAKFVWTIESQAIDTRDGQRFAGVLVEADPIDTVEKQHEADDAALLAAVVANPGKPSGMYAENGLRPDSMARENARKAMTRLRDAGKVHLIPGEKNARLVHPGPPPLTADEPFATPPPAPKSTRKRGAK